MKNLPAHVQSDVDEFFSNEQEFVLTGLKGAELLLRSGEILMRIKSKMSASDWRVWKSTLSLSASDISRRLTVAQDADRIRENFSNLKKVSAHAIYKFSAKPQAVSARYIPSPPSGSAPARRPPPPSPAPSAEPGGDDPLDDDIPYLPDSAPASAPDEGPASPQVASPFPGSVGTDPDAAGADSSEMTAEQRRCPHLSMVGGECFDCGLDEERVRAAVHAELHDDDKIATAFDQIDSKTSLPAALPAMLCNWHGLIDVLRLLNEDDMPGARELVEQCDPSEYGEAGEVFEEAIVFLMDVRDTFYEMRNGKSYDGSGKGPRAQSRPAVSHMAPLDDL